MKIKVLVYIIMILVNAPGFGGIGVSSAQALDRHPEAPAILDAAESLFLSMKHRDYRAIWTGLTEKSKNHIVGDVHGECRKVQADCSRERVAADFAAGGPVATAYWDSYLFHFDPETVLEQSTWAIDEIKSRRAAVTIRHEGSENPAILKMLKEEGAWKVGLEETFRTRRLLPK